MIRLQTIEQVRGFLEETIARSGFQLNPVSFASQSDWALQNGVIAHRTRGFFEVIGLNDQNREYLLLYQPQSAITGLLIHRTREEIYLLLQARIEPGNTGVGQYGPTVQSTPANFFQLHGGKKSSNIDYFLHHVPGSLPIDSSMQLDLGGRYYLKSKWHTYVAVTDFLETNPTMAWVSMSAILEGLPQDQFFNADLRSLLAVFDWQSFLGEERIPLRAPASTLMKDYLFRRTVDKSLLNLVALDAMEDWECTPTGVFPKNQDLGVSIPLFHVRSSTREVTQWVQPLVQAQTTGSVRLYVRSEGADRMYLLSIISEIGVSGGVCIGPSEIRYPGEQAPDKMDRSFPGKVLHSFWECDEGGRFLHHDSEYQVISVDSTFPVASNQYWVSGQELVSILHTSNMASFQLRCICSVLLAELYPAIGRN